MENKSAFWGNSINYGLITGLATIIYSIILYIMNLTFNRSLGLLSILILLIGIIYGTKVFRDKNQGGFITYGQALVSGVIIALIVAILGGIFTYILNVFIDPDLTEKGLQFMEEQLVKKERFSDDQIEMIIERARERTNPIKSAFWSMLGTTVIGFILSLITSAFLKKEQQPTG